LRGANEFGHEDVFISVSYNTAVISSVHSSVNTYNYYQQMCCICTWV